jgi:hypothetical protein
VTVRHDDDTIGYYTDDECLCLDCFTEEVAKIKGKQEQAEFLDEASPATFVGLPDGFTCPQCAKVVLP